MEILNEPPSYSSLLDYIEPTSRYRQGDLMEVLRLSGSHVNLACDGDPRCHPRTQENQSPFMATLDALPCDSFPTKFPTIITAAGDHFAQSSCSVQSSTNEFLQSPLDSVLGCCNVNQYVHSEGSSLSGAFGSGGRSGRLDQLADFMFDEIEMECAGELLDAWFLEGGNEFSPAQVPLQAAQNNSLSGSSCGNSLNLDKEASLLDQRESNATFPGKQSIACLGAGSVRDIELWEERVDSGSDESSCSVTRVFKGLEHGHQGSQACLGGIGCPGLMSEDKNSQVVFSARHGFDVSSGESKRDYDVGSCVKLNSYSRKEAYILPNFRTFDVNHVKVQEVRRDSHPFRPSSPAWVRPEMDFSEACLVQLLTTSAEAIATRDMDLASVILARLKELVSCTGSSIQRVAAYFSEGLQCCITNHKTHHFTPPKMSQGDLLAAFQVVHEICPYIKFGHFSANQAILDAVEGEKRVHIVDFEIMEGIQWPALMQALVSRKQGPPQLRITALCRSDAERGLAEVQETGKRLGDFAASLGLPFNFTILRVSTEEEFSPSSVRIVKGEALVVNCMLHLPHMPHRTASSILSFLQGMRQLTPVVLTLVEEELGCSTSVASSLLDSLLHYSAICDSLEACLLNTTVHGCMLVERTFLAPRINSTVKVWSSRSPRLVLGPDFPSYKWCSLVRSVGFKSLPLSSQNLSQARLLLGLYKDGFEVKEQSNRLVLRWQGKSLFATSVWN